MKNFHAEVWGQVLRSTENQTRVRRPVFHAIFEIILIFIRCRMEGRGGEEGHHLGCSSGKVMWYYSCLDADELHAFGEGFLATIWSPTEPLFRHCRESMSMLSGWRVKPHAHARELGAGGRE